jgi:selenophosphate synthase
MAALNKQAAEIMIDMEVGTGTDMTGFGLTGRASHK